MSDPLRIPLAYGPDTALRCARLVRRPWFMFLDSCATRTASGRYDILACDPAVTLVTRGDTTEIRDLHGVAHSREDPFALLRAALARHPLPLQERPFAGGAIGYFAYDLARRIERLPSRARHDIDLPDMAVGVYDWAIVVDHGVHRAELVARAGCGADLEAIRGAWDAQAPVTPAAFTTSFTVTAPARPESTFDEYAAAWRRIHQYIVDGDVYQVNLAQRFSAPVRGESWDAYQRLRNLNAAPFSAYLALPEGAVLSSSPERFLRVRDGWVETKPIKGTRPRASDPDLDAALARELAASAKDRAENVMIVDLLRNDLGKNCATGSVEVPALFEVESFAKVHHLVSTVRGRLADGRTALDVLRGCFPGGSITGAPKLRAMEIIEELEPCRRNVYCGAIGYVSFDGTMDTNIAIRTLVHHRDRMYCWAGGGIVMDSELEAEYAECFDKASAMLDVFAAAEVPGVDR